MTSPRHFSSYTQARQQLGAVLDNASREFVTTIDRDDERFVVVTAAQQRENLAALRPANASVVAEGAAGRSSCRVCRCMVTVRPSTTR